MATPLVRRPDSGGDSPMAIPAGTAAAEYLLPADRRGVAKFAIATPMYWSNTISGGVLVLLALAGLATLRRATR